MDYGIFELRRGGEPPRSHFDLVLHSGLLSSCSALVEPLATRGQMVVEVLWACLTYNIQQWIRLSWWPALAGAKT